LTLAAEPDSIVVRCALDDREWLLSEAPAIAARPFARTVLFSAEGSAPGTGSVHGLMQISGVTTRKIDQVCLFE
jgi:hypothetical protein